MPLADDQSIKEVLGLDPVAVVGCSRNPGKPAHDVPRYLVDQGYELVPVNPYAEEILGRQAVSSVEEIDREVPLITVFRPSDEVPGIVQAVLDRSDVRSIWLQVGISHDVALERAEDDGRVTVQDRCMKIEHRRLFTR